MNLSNTINNDMRMCVRICTQSADDFSFKEKSYFKLDDVGNFSQDFNYEEFGMPSFDLFIENLTKLYKFDNFNKNDNLLRLFIKEITKYFKTVSLCKINARAEIGIYYTERHERHALICINLLKAAILSSTTKR